MNEADAGELKFERRRYPRFNVRLPIEFTIVAEGRRCRAMVDNVSLAGVLLLTDEPLDQGTAVVVHMPAGKDGALDIPSKIVRTSVVGEFGVAFIGMTEEDVERISKMLERRSEL